MYLNKNTYYETSHAFLMFFFFVREWAFTRLLYEYIQMYILFKLWNLLGNGGLHNDVSKQGQPVWNFKPCTVPYRVIIQYCLYQRSI